MLIPPADIIVLYFQYTKYETTQQAIYLNSEDIARLSQNKCTGPFSTL